ncbi:peptidyl-prolyl cis-trans isomerase [Seongchinamella sediminis]|uniref:Peptidyl-prolyl cis-trans isomerase n=1 Tax=Seongchinamella sediminis TaxID=2283635 RepID=A0A3L7DWM5_9GAMM|nr:peptidyl-prolyl cis-trans isomerase [Seongchinamella sediminis]RLQ21536.1 peptidyl-prolyl cis-trans isomerase [Seongchinamella sediminis]
MNLLARLNRPWLHFLLIGWALYLVLGRLFPAPPVVIGPLSEARLEALQQQWLSTVGRMPTEQQMARMVTAELDRDMMFQRGLELELHLYDPVVYQRLLRNMHFLGIAEGKSDQALYEQALEMRLHLGDEVVKRRLIQIVEQLLLAGNPPAAPTEADIAREFAERREELRRPPRYSIEHVYFNREREAEVEQVVASITSESMGPAQARELGSPFLPGYRFMRQSPEQLARHFGAAFVMNLEQAGPQPGQWLGPIRSTYGLHYVYVEALEPGRDASLEEVRSLLVRDLESEARAGALQQSIEQLRQDYEVRR